MLELDNDNSPMLLSLRPNVYRVISNDEID